MYELQITTCSRDDVETLHEVFDQFNTLSVTLTDQFDDPILEPQLGQAPLWPHVVIQALYEHQDEAAHVARFLSNTHPALQCNIVELVQQDWVRACVADVKSQQFGQRLWVDPSWVTPTNTNDVHLILDPGLAFGTGTHPTTALCLRWLDSAHLIAQDVIDYGCGSGILGLAALKLGARHVHAIDIDPQALLATRQNAEVNNIPTTQLSVTLTDVTCTKADILLANILLNPLLTLQKTFQDALKPHGTLIISGILKEQVTTLVMAYAPCFEHKTTIIDGDWALAVFELSDM